MSRRRDPLRLSPHWHVDCRIETDIPEDRIIGSQFLANIGFTAVAVGMTLLLAWMGYHTLQLQTQIKGWEQRIDESRAEVNEIRKMQREYVIEAYKIDRAYEAIRPTFFASEFLKVVARTLPPQIAVDMVEWNERGIIIRGNVRESNQLVAAGVLGTYVKILRNDEKFSQRFRAIQSTAFAPAKNGDFQNFALEFTLQPLPSL